MPRLTPGFPATSLRAAGLQAGTSPPRLALLLAGWEGDMGQGHLPSFSISSMLRGSKDLLWGILHAEGCRVRASWQLELLLDLAGVLRMQVGQGVQRGCESSEGGARPLGRWRGHRRGWRVFRSCERSGAQGDSTWLQPRRVPKMGAQSGLFCVTASGSLKKTEQ